MKIIKIMIVAGLAVVAALGVEARSTSVRGYTRSNGTYVRPYVRNSSPRSNAGYSSTYSCSSSSRKSYTPKSYSVYQQRQTQGPRTFSRSLKQQKYTEQGGVCNHCKKSCTYREMEGDHIVPYSKGGATTAGNLQMLCRPCNRSKGNRYNY